MPYNYLLHNRAYLSRAIQRGVTVRELAEHLSVSRSTVRDQLEKFHIDPRQGRKHEPTLNDLAEYRLSNGLRQRQLEQSWNLTREEMLCR